MKTKLLAPIIISLMLASCTGGLKYLKAGETNKSGNLSQTIVGLKYIGQTSDEKRNNYVLTYKLHSYYEKTMALSGMFSYGATFDDTSGNGGILIFDFNSIYPSAISPDSDETVAFTISGFTDWEKVKISYSDSQTGISYSFGLNRSDFNLNDKK
ncbi:MAG: hypothetical protein K5694_06740 [Bacilli bacterium]|nr:hypothetical protein [Bacilli bacterium]